MILNSPYISGSLTVTGNTTIQGQLTVTGSLSGTASLASNALLLQGTGSTGFATTASVLQVSSSQQEISASLLQVSASYVSLSGSYNTFSGSASTRITVDSASLLQVSSSQQQISSSQQQISSSYIALSGSYNTFSGSASTRVTQIEQVYATTGSNSFRANQSITGSLVVSSTITAQTLVVQTVTSSIIYSSGSNNFGNQLANTQTFTGSLNVTGSSHAIFGNVGINTTAPTVALQVYSTGSSSSNVTAEFWNGDYGTGTKNFIRLRNAATVGSTTSAYFGQGQDQKTYFYNNDFSRLGDIVITNTGKVGIGTASPIAQLHIKTDVASASRPTTLATSATNSAAYITTICGSGAGIAFGQLGANTSYIQATYENGSACTSLALNPYGGGVGIGTGNNAFSGQKLFIESNNDQAGITMYNSYDCNMWALATGTTGINNKGFAIRDEINGVTRLQIDNCGRIGIGTLSPTVELSVKPGTDNAAIRVGTWAIMENVTTNQTMFGYNAAYATSLGTGWRYINNGYAMGIRMHDAYGSGDIMFHLSCCGSGGTNIGSTWDSTDLKMIIKNNGNVGINNSVPLAALEVGQSCSDQNNGGFTFKTMALADNTWTTFFTPPANWAGLTTLNWVGTNDFNRSGAAQIRWSYQSCAAQLGPTTTIFNDNQNAPGYFRNSGGNMQICVDGAGAGKRLQIMIMGSRGA